MIALDRAVCEDFDQARQREWLVTNGLGGYASGTLAMPTRRYHALLMAAVDPPAVRSATLVRLEEALTVAGHAVRLDTHEFADGTITGAGYRLLQEFRLESGLPVWRYAVDGIVLERRLWMTYGEDHTNISYRLVVAPQPIALTLTPLIAWRDQHATQQKVDAGFVADPLPFGCRVTLADDQWLSLTCDGASYQPDPDWYYRFLLREEAARGYDAVEALFRPGMLRLTLQPGEEVVFQARYGRGPAPAVSREPSLDAEVRRRQALLDQASAVPDTPRAQLTLAADQFIVRRGANGASIIAGYPWFADWGRDSMIALPGLTLTTGRHGEARTILTEWAQWLQDGLLPNRFPDQGATPEYNSADASLWFIHAADRYLDASGDTVGQRVLYPALASVVAHYRTGTRFGIGVDPADGLLRAGAPGLQLTWMDAKVGDWVVTPRRGKPVELSALWYNALRVLEKWSRELGHSEQPYADLAARCAQSFNSRFWYAAGAYLFDVVDGEKGDDASLRPNQLLAVSLPYPVLDANHRRAVVDTVAGALLTPMGLRTLSPNDPAYRGVYHGDQATRDAAYHQGTVWPWLLGSYLSAHDAVYGDRSYVNDAVAIALTHLSEAGIGSVSEVFDSDLPHAPNGCFAQAWSVAELLRNLPPVGGVREGRG